MSFNSLLSRIAYDTLTEVKGGDPFKMTLKKGDKEWKLRIKENELYINGEKGDLSQVPREVDHVILKG